MKRFYEGKMLREISDSCTDSKSGEKMNTERIQFIRAKLKDDYVFDSIRNMGFKIIIPYKDRNLLLRLLREAWFRLRLPHREIWYNPDIETINADIIVLFDSLMVPELISYLREKYPDARIILNYENRADRTLHPARITDASIEKWSYDQDDCEQYGMNFLAGGYPEQFIIKEKKKPEYDVVYVGRDKGRKKRLCALEKELKRSGLKPYFRICPDRKYIHPWKLCYKKILKYEDYLALIAGSRSILNIMPEGQISITTRDLESVFNGIKEITNNKGIMNYDFYHKSRFFVLGMDDIKMLPDFLREPFVPVDQKILETYTAKHYYKKLLNISEDEWKK